MAEGVGIPYQSLINLYFRDCVSSHREFEDAVAVEERFCF